MVIWLSLLSLDLIYMEGGFLAFLLKGHSVLNRTGKGDELPIFATCSAEYIPSISLISSMILAIFNLRKGVLSLYWIIVLLSSSFNNVIEIFWEIIYCSSKSRLISLTLHVPLTATIFKI